MTEKKRVTVMVDAKTVSPAGQSEAFNFSGFTTGGHSLGTGAAPQRSAPQEDDEPVTSYQAGRKSIVQGVAATDLLHMHRKSLSQFSQQSGGVNPENFTGVTLSRRHRVTQEEYDAGQDEETKGQLQGFSFGTAE